MSEASKEAVYDFIVSRPGLSDIVLAQELKAAMGITRIVDCLDLVKSTREAILDV